MAVLTSSPPEQGQLVTVRQRRYVVTEIAKSTLPDRPLKVSGNGAQHLITLSSVEDDALGDELQVIWEIEPGAQVIEKVALPEPTGFDEPERLDAFLDAVRWGAASTADVKNVQSPFRSGIDIEDYQLDPVVRAIQMPRVNLLIADDVGLGKTIEAGMVKLELVIRNRARRILIVCPASLQVQWRDQMRDKFGLDYRIVDSELMRTLRRKRGIHVNPWMHFPRLITSIDFIKRERPLRLFKETLPSEGESVYPRRYDILVLDEAHNCAPSARGKYATDSLRTQALRLMVPHFEHKLFLTATPHNGYQESFSALLELLDDQRFARGTMPDRKQLGAVMVRRLKSELPKNFDGSDRFPKRKIEPIEVPYTGEEKAIHTALKKYTKLRHQNVADNTEKMATEFVLLTLKKRLFSSPAAFAATLEQHEKSLRTAKRRTAATKPTIGILQRQIDKVEEEYADDALLEEATDDAVEAATRLFREPTGEEAAVLKQMRDWAATAKARGDSKSAKLVKWLKENIKPNGKWSDNRAILFSEYRASQNWLQTILATEGLSGNDRLMTMYGGMDSDKREAVKAAFQTAPEKSPVRILLATDAASEGLDLQNFCHRLIHYEIPWNPNRMEQRNGRIDRHGQRHKPLVYHFVGEGYKQREKLDVDVPVGELEGDLEFLMRAVRKVEAIREDLGKVGPVIADQVQEAMLGRRARLDTARAEKDAEPARKMLKIERDVQRDIQRLREQLDETRRELRLSPENVEHVVKVGLKLAKQPELIPTVVERKGNNGEVRTTVEEKLKSIQDDNAKNLEQMRQTVDEKLQETLEKRLGESFKLVSERLEQVYKGLGEMQTLAVGVGDLKRVLTNVKARGTWGEVQLERMLEQVLCPEQYDKNVATKDGGERVEFAIKLPGRGEDKEEIVWLPIDAKFPIEDYQRLQDAQEKGDGELAEAAAKQLEIRIKGCANDICLKYLNPPKTTDFGILFLPTEGLFAEVVRRPGLPELIQRECKVVVAGPTTLWSILNSLQMGFRTLAIQQRSSEVWNLLAAVKTEFGKYGDVLAGVQKKLQEAANKVEDVGKRSRAIGRKLRDVQELPVADAQKVLMLEGVDGEGNGEQEGG